MGWSGVGWGGMWCVVWCVVWCGVVYSYFGRCGLYVWDDNDRCCYERTVLLLMLWVCGVEVEAEV